MNKTIDKLFNNDRLFFALPWIVFGTFILSVLAVLVVGLTVVYRLRIAFVLIQAILLYVAVRSYRTHNKNLMKATVGAMLASLFYANLLELLNQNGIFDWEFYFKLVALAFVSAFIIIHFVIVSNHYSNTRAVIANQNISFVYLAAVLFVDIYYMVHYVSIGIPLEIVDQLIYLLSTFPTILGIICIEYRVNEFKIRREKNGYVFER